MIELNYAKFQNWGSTEFLSDKMEDRKDYRIKNILANCSERKLGMCFSLFDYFVSNLLCNSLAWHAGLLWKSSLLKIQQRTLCIFKYIGKLSCTAPFPTSLDC